MTLVLADLRSELRKILGTDSTDLPNADADLLLNRSFWEVLDKFPFREKERQSSFVYTIGERRYAAPSPFEAVQKIVVVSDDDALNHTPLDRMDKDEYERKFSGHIDARGMPTHYFREDTDFIVYPTPDLAYTGVIYYLITLNDLSDSNITPPIPQAWHEIILFGAGWRGWINGGDYLRAKALKDNQVTLINSTSPVEAKEEADSRYSGIEIPAELTRAD